MKVIRYSKSGFEPQKQSHHMNHILYHINGFSIHDYPVFMQREIMESHNRLLEFYKEAYHDLEEGVWVFIDGHKNRQALNHLKEKVPCWEAELPDDTPVYDVNWTKHLLLSDPECTCFGCYVPAGSLQHIKNIKRRKR